MDVKAELESELSDKAIFKTLTKDFSEKKLFYNLAKQLVGDRRIRIYNERCFDDQQPSPDIAIRTRRRLFMFEYKDMRVRKEVADGYDMTVVMDYIDNRLNKEKDKEGGNKGLPQLISNMEDFFSGKRPWGDDYKKGHVKIHPVMVINNRLFGVRGINYILQEKMGQRIKESEILRLHKSQISELLVLDYDMLIMVVAQTYKNFGGFQDLMFSYLTYVRKSPNMVGTCDSYRHYVMNKWEREMTDKDKKVLKIKLKRLLKTMMRDACRE